MMHKLISCMSAKSLRKEGEIFKDAGMWWEVTRVNDPHLIKAHEDGSKEYKMAEEHSRRINWFVARYKIWRRG